MIDIHSHLLYGLDDGASKIEDSIRMLSEAQKVGIQYIISTVHYHDDFYSADKMRDTYKKVSSRAADFGITLKTGYEIFITDSITNKVNRRSELTLNNSDYVLIEFPYSEFPTYSYEVLYQLYLKGIKPILSHPERCRFFVENPEVLLSFVESGCHIQVDAASIIGVYGRHARSMAKMLLKRNKVDFVASNAHFADDYSDWFLQAYHKVRKWAGSEYANQIFNKNAEVILDNSNFDLSTNLSVK